MAKLNVTNLVLGDTIGVWHYHYKPKHGGLLLEKDLAFLGEVTQRNSTGRLMISRTGMLYDNRIVMVNNVYAHAVIRVRDSSYPMSRADPRKGPLKPFEIITDTYPKTICPVIRIDDHIISVKS